MKRKRRKSCGKEEIISLKSSVIEIKISSINFEAYCEEVFFFLEKFTLPKCQVNIKYSKNINTYIRIYIKHEIFYINTNSIITLALFTEKYKF